MKLKSSHVGFAAVLAMLVLLPAPILPPHGFAEWIQSTFRTGWKGSYLVAAVVLHFLLYGSLGVIIGISASVSLQRKWTLVCVPFLAVIGVVIIRSLKIGHVHVLSNAIVPMTACFLGVALSLLFRVHGWPAMLAGILVAAAVLGWTFAPADLSLISRLTQAHLQRLVTSSAIPAAGEKRFGVILETAFSPLENPPSAASALEHNRSALLALGIAIGHERFARFAGLSGQEDLIQTAAALRSGTSLGGREDWARHFCLSAAIAVLEDRFVSDASGLMKEQLDALAQGSGFSFGDLAADRAGRRFAEAATHSESDAKEMQARLLRGYVADDFFPRSLDLPENLTVEDFRREFGGVGTRRYRDAIDRIEVLLDQCPALRSPGGK